MEYIRLNEGLDKYTLIPADDNIWNYIKDKDNKDYYTSIYKYNDSHYNTWKTTKTIRGIKDVTTNKLVFDFDDSTNPDNARKDATTLVSRLLSYGIQQDTIQVAFSGQKGYSIVVDTDKKFTPDEFKNVTFALAKDLKSFDPVINDPNRIFRVTGTRHPKTGLYKFPLSVNQLAELPVEEVKKLAADLSNVDDSIPFVYPTTQLSNNVEVLKIPKKEVVKPVEIDINDLDLTKKPKWLSPQKYALQEGFFQSGERNTAFMIMASTYKSQGFSKEIVYRMLKGVAEKQAIRNNSDRYSDDELWNNITNVVFAPGWKGGTYSVDNTPLLKTVSERLNLPISKVEDTPLVPVENITSAFKKFATDIDANTLKLGIPQIDNKIRVTTSMAVGLLAGPGSGKSTLSFGILNQNSLNGISSLFFSLDMGAPLVYQRLIQKHLGYTDTQIYNIYKNNDQEKMNKIEKVISDNYKNVKFCFRSGFSIEDIRNSIVKYQDDTGDKVRLVVIDYLECISGPFSDQTANSGYVAQALKDIANDLELCILILLQPQKAAGDPSEELMSYRNIKGSSQIEQCLSIIFTLWRPGFSPKNPEEDRYASIAVVKNRMGALAKFDFSWDGLSGEMDELDEYQKEELKELVDRKRKEKLAKDLI